MFVNKALVSRSLSVTQRQASPVEGADFELLLLILIMICKVITEYF
jgi:hypothetical protein